MAKPREEVAYQAVLALVRVGGQLRKTADRFFKRFELTQSQFNVLMVLHHEAPEGCSQKEISERLLVKGANTTALLRRLQRRKLIEREADPSDERARVVSITPKGRKLLARAEPVYYRTVAGLMDGVPVRGLQEFIKTLEAAQRAIDGMDAA